MKKKHWIIVAVVAVLGVASAFYFNQLHQRDSLPEGFASSNGRIELATLDIATLRAGRVAQVLVKEGQAVAQDTPLVVLSSDELATQLDSAIAARAQAQAGKAQAEAAKVLAKANKTQAEAAKMQAQGAVRRAQSAKKRAQGSVARSEGTTAQADAEIAVRQAQLNIARTDLDNTRALRRDKLVSKAELQQRQQAYDAALAAVAAAKAARAQSLAGSNEAQAGVQEADAGIEEAQAAVGQAQAGIEQADAGIQQADGKIQEAQAAIDQAQAAIDRVRSIEDDLVIKAPRETRVEYTVAKVGNVLGAGSKVVTLVDPADVYLDIFLPTQNAGQLQLNTPARIVIDGVDAVFPAEVTFVASQAQFTPKSVETKNEREKMMYRVKLSMDRETALQYKDLLKAGMTAEGIVRLDANESWPDEYAVRLPQQSAGHSEGE